MHGHIGGVSQGADWDYVFKLWLAHGVTTVREPSGRGVEYAVDLKKRSSKNEIIAPRILAYTGFGQGSKKPISTEEQAREWVRENAKNGADGIKFFGAEPKIMSAALNENNKFQEISETFVKNRYEVLENSHIKYASPLALFGRPYVDEDGQKEGNFWVDHYEFQDLKLININQKYRDFYEKLKIACQPVAINSGNVWPKKGLKRPWTNECIDTTNNSHIKFFIF